MEAGADLQQAADASANLRPSGRRPRNARKDLQKRGLTGTVATDEAENFAFADFQRNVLQGPEGFVLRRAECGERERAKFVNMSRRSPCCARPGGISCRGLRLG